MSSFTVQVGEFEGPLSVLLELIEKRKMHVSEVSLAAVADDFLAYVRAQELLPTREVAQFLVVAATLLLLKSKSLLPLQELHSDEEESIGQLERQLALHKVYVSAEQALREFLGQMVGLPQPRSARVAVGMFAPGKNLSVGELHERMRELLTELPDTEQHEKAMLLAVVSIKEMMQNMVERVRTAPQRLREFSREKQELIVAFLALLELVKDGHLLAEESEGDISITYRGAVS